VDPSAALDPVQPGIPRQRPRPVQVEDELAVRERPSLGLVPELPGLPGLPLVLAEVLDDERPDVGDREQPLARGVDREPPQIGRDPAPPQLLGHRRRRARAGEAVEDEVTLVRRGTDDTLE